ncbi:MAG: hypothetical protein ABFC38_12260 [Methanospirillum sp.]
MQKPLSSNGNNRDRTNAAESRSIPAARRCSAPADGSPAVGDILTPACAGNPGPGHGVVIALLIDGSRQVVLEAVV